MGNAKLNVNQGITIIERAQNASSRSLSDVSSMTFNLALEFLNTCEYHCSGCFVNRRNSFTEQDLLNVVALCDDMSKLSGVELNEIVVGPTDFFATENVEELFARQEFLDLFNKFSAITITSTLQARPAHVASLLESTLHKLPKGTHLELFVAVDVERLMANDLIYISTLESNLKLLSDANVLFIFNMYKHPLFERYSDVATVINTKYNSHLKMNPSFFRGKKSTIIRRELSEWKRTIERAVENSNLSGFLMNVADDYFGGNTYVTLTYKQGDILINPCFYDYVLDEQEEFKVPEYTTAAIFDKMDDLALSQYDYAKHTTECADCPLLASCISKKVLTVMQYHEVVDCLMPKEIILKMTNRSHISS